MLIAPISLFNKIGPVSNFYFFQLNITGAYFVGGIRLCLRGPGLVQGVNTLHYLDTCQFYFTDNETIGHDVTVPIVLIKIINQTQPLQVDGDTLYDGRWTPTWNTANGLSDKLIYEQNGEYLRYASYQNFLTITLTEQPFFVQNNQQPIIRKAELAFLLVKMIGIPLLLPILRFFHSRISAAPKENSIPSITTTSVSFGGSVTSTPKVKHKLSHIFKRSQDNDLVDKFKF